MTISSSQYSIATQSTVLLFYSNTFRISDSRCRRTTHYSQVTQSNFKEALPAVREALEACQFYAFDLEMTGLHLKDGMPPFLDEMDDRYRTVSCAVESANRVVTGILG